MNGSTRNPVIEEVRGLLPAVRAFDKVWAPVAASYDAGREADYAIDCGEWGAAASDASEGAEYDECVARVAQRFGVPQRELQMAIGYRDGLQQRAQP